MTNRYDAIIVGLGVMGHAAARALAGAGLRILGIEQFAFAHDHGSSHGRSRVARTAYFEDPRYVPLAQRALAGWRTMPRPAGRMLIHPAGCLNVGPPEHPAMIGLQRSVAEHGLAHERLDAGQIARRWPAMRPLPSDIGIYETEAGLLDVSVCMQQLADDARQAGAHLRYNCRATDWTATNESVIVRTADDSFECLHLVIAAGPWLGGLAADLRLPLRVERQTPMWFRPASGGALGPTTLPMFIHFTPRGVFYGLPDFDGAGVKVARHHGGEPTGPDAVDRLVQPADVADVRGYLAEHLPALDGPPVHAEVCLYTNTPDEHFIVDHHPRYHNVLIAGGFSGHGFKFAPVIAELLCDLVLGPAPAAGASLFRIDRFGA